MAKRRKEEVSKPESADYLIISILEEIKSMLEEVKSKLELA